MIRVIGANPAMDRIATWPPLRLGEVNRAAGVSVVPGGKGFNVARAAVRLGHQATAYGFLGDWQRMANKQHMDQSVVLVAF